MKTKVYFVIDESGSMGPQANDVRGGFNEYIKTLKKESKDAEIEVSAAAFHTQVRPIFSALPLSEVPKLTNKNYNPGGGTALLDAIGFGLNEIREKELADSYCKQCKTHHGNPYGNPEDVKYLFVIMTDGEENSSRTFQKKDIKDKIDRRQKNENWTFVYLGANQDAFSEAGGYGIPQANSWTYNVLQTGSTLRGLASNTASYANSGATASANFAGATYGGQAGDWTVTKTTVQVPVDTSTTVTPPKKNKKHTTSA